LHSAHDVGEGGTAVALAECCMSGPVALGAMIEIQASIRPDAFLFGESQSRILVSLRRRHLGRLRELAKSAGVALTVLGEVRGQRLVIEPLIDVAVQDLEEAWRAALPAQLEASA
jgi:phosphoribosylformylglycinamidine synthase